MPLSDTSFFTVRFNGSPGFTVFDCGLLCSWLEIRLIYIVTLAEKRACGKTAIEMV
jgi:hypothetical protein